MVEPTDPTNEITAMKSIADALSPLDEQSRARVLRWANDRFRSEGTTSQVFRDEIESAEVPSARTKFSDLAELYAAASPSTEADKALVVGYWYQFIEREADLGSQVVNSALKNLGHGVTNITSAFDTLKAQNPALVMQVRKSGTTKQARKKYKLTAAGKKAVEQMLGGQED